VAISRVLLETKIFQEIEYRIPELEIAESPLYLRVANGDPFSH